MLVEKNGTVNQIGTLGHPLTNDTNNIQVCGLDPYYAGYDYYYNRIKETGSCYYFSTWQARHWRDARAHCEYVGSGLLVLDDDNERRIVQDILQQWYSSSAYSYYWYIGISADWNRIWYTYDGDLLSDLGYEPWAPGEPNDYDDNEYCGAVLQHEVLYNDVPCFNGWRNFICKQRALSELIKYS